MTIMDSAHPVLNSILAILLIGGFFILVNKKLRKKIFSKFKKDEK